MKIWELQKQKQKQTLFDNNLEGGTFRPRCEKQSYTYAICTYFGKIFGLKKHWKDFWILKFSRKWQV
jgi:hypothetical protein